MKKVIGLISELLEQKQYKSAQEWICKLQNNSNLFFSYTTYSNHTLLNALLNSKVELCKSNNIDVKCLICGKIDGIDDIELYCLMVNLLDNAIEAAKMSETPYISLFVNASETEIMGEIINSIQKSNYKNFEDILPKEYSDGHGYGMININEIIKKNNGNINYCLLSSGFVKVTYMVEKTLMTKQ